MKGVDIKGFFCLFVVIVVKHNCQNVLLKIGQDRQGCSLLGKWAQSSLTKYGQGQNLSIIFSI